MNKRKVIFGIVAVLAVLGIIMVIFNMNKPKNYKCLVLGDSISAGYGLEDSNDCYSNQMVTKIKEDCLSEKDTITIKNEAVSGTKSSELLEQIQEGKINIDEDTDIITMSIGGNDVLKPCLEIVDDIKQDFSGDSIDVSNITGGLNKIINLKEKLSDNPEIIKSAEGFSDNFAEIIKAIKEKAPDCKIYVMNVYNPYNDCNIPLFDIADITEKYINILNKAFSSESDEYTLIDVYNAFKNEKDVINANITKFDFDPHPNSKGHKVIADLFAESIKKNSLQTK